MALLFARIEASIGNHKPTALKQLPKRYYIRIPMMHRALSLLLLFISIAVQGQSQTDEIAAMEGKSHAHIHKGLRSEAADNANITYIRLELQADPAVNYLQGKVTSVFIPRTTIDFIEFDLTDSLLVDSIIYHNNSIAYTRPGNSLLRIELPAMLAENVADSIAVYYQGVPRGGDGFGSFVQSKHGMDSVPIIWTLSEPYGAKDWWPCKQNLTDKIDSIDIWITCPQQYRATSNGMLISETQQGANKLYKWKHRYPIVTYLVAIAVTNYAVFSEYAPIGNDTIEILNYVYPEGLTSAQAEVPKNIAQMQLFDSLFGPYPFVKERYGHAQFGWGGGMEHQTMSFMYNFGYELMAHELAHQWFGDKVTCRSWQDIWLNEGFATYLTALCYQYIQPQYFSVFKQQRINNVTSQPDGSVFCYDTTSVGRIFNGRLSYNKGAMVLNMLRWVIGDEAFFGGLRSYLNDVSLAYSFATTPELKSHLEAASGKDLTDFFDTWIYKEGYPTYLFEWSQNFEGKVKLKVNQSQSHTSVNYFKLPLPIRFQNAATDTLMVFNNTINGEEYIFDLHFYPDTLVFDPDLWIIAANNTTVKKAAYNFHMTLFPNPVRDYVDVRIETEQQREVEVGIYSTSGKMLFSTKQQLVSGSNMLQLNTQNLAAGTYAIRVKGDHKPIAEKFIKAAN